MDSHCINMQNIFLLQKLKISDKKILILYLNALILIKCNVVMKYIWL